MNKGESLFVRIDYRLEGNDFSSRDFNDHIEYLTEISIGRKFIGGGFANSKGGMIIFEAKDIDEAKEICDNDPLIIKNLYGYELRQWDLVIVSEDV